VVFGEQRFTWVMGKGAPIDGSFSARTQHGYEIRRLRRKPIAAGLAPGFCPFSPDGYIQWVFERKIVKFWVVN